MKLINCDLRFKISSSLEEKHAKNGDLYHSIPLSSANSIIPESLSFLSLPSFFFNTVAFFSPLRQFPFCFIFRLDSPSLYEAVSCPSALSQVFFQTKNNSVFEVGKYVYETPINEKTLE